MDYESLRFIKRVGDGAQDSGTGSLPKPGSLARWYAFRQRKRLHLRFTNSRFL